MHFSEALKQQMFVVMSDIIPAASSAECLTPEYRL